MVRIFLVGLSVFLVMLVALPASHAYISTHGKITTYARGCPPTGCPPTVAPMGGGYPVQYMPPPGPGRIMKCKPQPMAAGGPMMCPPPMPCGPPMCPPPMMCKPPVRWY